MAAAIMAPSSHNTQPWRFRILGDRLELLADLRRHLRVIDRDRRQLVTSCGCALYNARVAVRAMGFADDVTVAAGGDDQELLATIRLGEHRPATGADLALMRALPVRRTNRRPFLDRPVPPADVELLLASVRAHGAWMLRLTPPQKGEVGHLVAIADETQLGDPAFRHELAAWLTPFASRRRDGIPFVEKEYGSGLPFALARAFRSSHLGHDVGVEEERGVIDSPVVVVLGTDGDDVRAWLACGEALQAALLHATHLGLAAAFANQVLEVPELRDRIVELIRHPGYPQLVLRFGYADEPVHHAAPRRDIADVLLEVE